MRILFYWWNAITRYDVEEALQNLEIEYDKVEAETDVLDLEDEAFCEKIRNAIKKRAYDALFSINYNHKIAYVCHECDLPYLAWSYDAPIDLGYFDRLRYDTTHLFLFDRYDVNRLKDQYGARHVYHLPLAVNTERFDKCTCTAAEKQKYGAQISFVGQLYSLNSEEAINTLSDFEKGYLNAVKDAQFKVYGENLITQCLTEEFMREVSTPAFRKAMGVVTYRGNEDEDEVLPSMGLEYLMQREVTKRERLLLLGLLSRHFQTALFSYETHSALQNVETRGRVGYLDEMPKVFKSSDINLNITLRSIVTGIPQRCLDIMACKGFLLSNYQPELAEWFENEKDCVMYSSIEEALDYCNFYIENQTIRGRIAQKGYEAVKKRFSYEERLEKCFYIL